jgi:sugar O-acyltransferase (sialic acid O-acetyltransferase NeuD family)
MSPHGTSHRRPLVIVGSGDHARVIREALVASGDDPDGFVNLQPGTESTAPGLEVVGDLVDDLAWMTRLTEARFVVAIGRNDVREAAFRQAIALGLEPLTVIHPAATLLGGCVVGPGSQVCARAVIGVDARIGANVIINTAASVDHDDVVDDHASVGPGAHLAGRVSVGAGTHIGLGASVREGTTIGAWSLVASGAAVVRDVGDGARVAGVPARPMS